MRVERSWLWRFAAPPEQVWARLADTARFNEAAGLPRHTVEPAPGPDGAARFRGRARWGPLAMAWTEPPAEWVAPRWLAHRRRFARGPLRAMDAELSLSPAATGCEARYALTLESRGALGRLLFGPRAVERAGARLAALAREAEAHAAGAAPLLWPRPEPDAELRERVADRVARVEASGRGHGLAARLGARLLRGQDAELERLRPLALARDWDAPPRHVVELCLQAAREGLLALSWDLLCPNCRAAKSESPALDALPEGAHCDACEVDYDRDFSRNVELSFRPAADIRPLGEGVWCLFGPMSTPHVRLQLTLGPGERRELAFAPPPGRLRARTLESGLALTLKPSARLPALSLGEDGWRVGAPAPEGRATLENRLRVARTLLLEELAWTRDALTADRVIAFQAFRDLFSDQVLRPGDQVGVARAALLFSDLSGSTALYERLGEAAAYALVREHFAVLAAAVRAEGGAVVKTIGDAVMAAFPAPAPALRAALAIRDEIAAFAKLRGAERFAIKLGLHDGPCIAVTLNDQLDYFGGTVNLAARLQALARDGEIVLSESAAADPETAPLLEGLRPAREQARPRGFARPVGLLRLPP